VEGLVTPWILLLLTFVLGIGAALNNPAWQASLPELRVHYLLKEN